MEGEEEADTRFNTFGPLSYKMLLTIELHSLIKVLIRQQVILIKREEHIIESTSQ
jgi:hypothetical protein